MRIRLSELCKEYETHTEDNGDIVIDLPYRPPSKVIIKELRDYDLDEVEMDMVIMKINEIVHMKVLKRYID